MLRSSYFLWPTPSLNRIAFGAFGVTSTKAIEVRLAAMFPGATPVLVSSARAGIRLTLERLGLGRGDTVGVFPYASHCVLDALARIATPGPLSSDSAACLLYHQWGYVQETSGGRMVIEDAVDTLCEPGARLFPAGGDFELWSLPKILGTLAGGVVWCRNKDDALSIRSMRDKSAGGWAMRALSHVWGPAFSCWAGTEASRGSCGWPGNGEIMSALNRWQEIFDDRKKKLKMLESLLPDWLQPNAGRLPCVVPVNILEVMHFRYKEMGITTGVRHMERLHEDGRRELLRMLPLPIHQDIPISVVEQMAEALI